MSLCASTSVVERCLCATLVVVFTPASVGATGFEAAGTSGARPPPAPAQAAAEQARPAHSAPDAGASATQAPKPVASDTNLEGMRRRELEDLRREDVAAQLALLGVLLKWQDHTLAELVDWRDRIEAAVILRVQHRVDADWRTTSLRDLIDMRLRAAKAAELSSLYGVRVDWRRYSWVALEGMRRQMAKTQPARTATAHDPDGLAAPGSTSRSWRQIGRSNDPDAILEPTFAFDTPLLWSRPFGRAGKSDPDAILVPRFVSVPSPPLGPDDVIHP